jgi:hypothetical protein
MNATARDFVNVDMRGLKAALIARSRADRVSVSTLVRAAVTRHLDGGAPPVDAGCHLDRASTAVVKLSIRMTATEVTRLDEAARRAGLSRGALLVGLLDGVSAVSGSATRGDLVDALRMSSEAVSTLARYIHHLTSLLREGSFRAAQEYRPMLEALNGDLRRHLRLASNVLADLQPGRAPSPPH